MTPEDFFLDSEQTGQLILDRALLQRIRSGENCGVSPHAPSARTTYLISMMRTPTSSRMRWTGMRSSIPTRTIGRTPFHPHELTEPGLYATSRPLDGLQAGIWSESQASRERDTLHCGRLSGSFLKQGLQTGFCAVTHVLAPQLWQNSSSYFGFLYLLQVL